MDPIAKESQLGTVHEATDSSSRKWGRKRTSTRKFPNPFLGRRTEKRENAGTDMGIDLETGAGSTQQETRDDPSVKSKPLDMASSFKDEPLQDDSSEEGPFKGKTSIIATLILLVGLCTAGFILGSGIRAAKREQEQQFNSLSGELILQFETAMDDYLTAGLWTHQACFRQRDTMTPSDFRVVYEYIKNTGLELQATSFILQVKGAEEREAVENRTRMFLQEEHPDLPYFGFTGFNTPGEPPGPRDEADVYYAIAAVEPFEDPKNKAALSFDVFTSGVRRKAVEEATRTYKPALTDRLKLIQETSEGTEQYAYSTILLHPGLPLSNSTPTDVYKASMTPRDLAFIVIRFPDTLVRARQNFPTMRNHASLYVFDSTPSEEVEDDKPPFLGGAFFHSDSEIEASITGDHVKFHNEIDLPDLKASPYRYIHERKIPIASREWTFVVVAHNDTFQPQLLFIFIGAAMIVVACMCLAAWIITNNRKLINMNQFKAKSDAEKAKIMVDNARAAAQKERELNDFLSHEVRNPVSAAISACSFVRSAVQEHSNEQTGELVVNPESREMIMEDVRIIDSSLQFVNDLLRNMLDMHRAASKQMQIHLAPADLLHDILEPVASILYQRGSDFQVLLECPEDLVVLTDKLRLKQTCLNLGRNATKFVEKGFVRLRAEVVNDTVRVYIEDTGPGIPLEKRKNLFGQFQEALDTLSQGTGMGLCLCKKLVELMKGELWLDEDYDSGVTGTPGARFVIDLKTGPIKNEVVALLTDSSADDLTETIEFDSQLTLDGRRLPEKLSVLFVDDDWKLRTQFSSTVDRIADDWKVREASNGETAIRLAEEHKFDVIFINQYMSSVVKQLLGTETVQSLRSRGVTAAICGVSENDAENSFLQAGANAFCMKPLPSDREEVASLLLDILDSKGNHKGSSKPAVGRKPMPKVPSKRNITRSNSATATPSTTESSLKPSLPRNMSVLVVDDDANLRQLYTRSLQRAAPTWKIDAVSSGEASLQYVNTIMPDIVFVDQYMPNTQVEKPMLGTEAVYALRAKGVTSIIVGLSANDMDKAFLEAGANFFHVKPFPCEKEEMTRELIKILGLSEVSSDSSKGNQKGTASAAQVPLPRTTSNSKLDDDTSCLPENLTILYAEDSPSLRKMFSRSIQRATKGWTIHNVESGEEALLACDSNRFDLIFLDQHQATEMLGTEIAKTLREEKGVTSIICGLSGDDIGSKFMDAGADAFCIKPFPCEKSQLIQELQRILQSRK